MPLLLLFPPFLATLSGCGSSLTPAAREALVQGTASDARFLTRATFGPTVADLAAVAQRGKRAWLMEQAELSPSLLVPRMIEEHCSAVVPGHEPCDDEEHIDLHIAMRDRLWWEHAVFAPDQVRQRVAFALSEIFVVSSRNAELEDRAVLHADFHDTLVRGVTSTYRDLLEEITLHPAMGVYLSMKGNRVADPSVGTRPDENYAREILQLFSIGLVQLDAAGRPIVDEHGNTIPTYDQNDVRELARVFTGWTYATSEPKTDDLEDFLAVEARLGRMEPWPAFHDRGAKTILGGIAIPADLSPEACLDLALDAIANHPNVGPFLARQLIQRLVTSNPSPAYIRRVATVFADDGSGVRGNLGAVVLAILLDEEAEEADGSSSTFGKAREPVLMATALSRAFGPHRPGDIEVFGDEAADELSFELGQHPLSAPSVFSFFSPFHAPVSLQGQGLVAPELQLVHHSRVVSIANLLGFLATEAPREIEHDEEPFPFPRLDLGIARALASSPADLVDYLDVLLAGGTLSQGSRAALLAHVQALPDGIGDEHPGFERATQAIALIVQSPDFAIQK